MKWSTVLCVVLANVVSCQAFTWDEPTALDDYVNFDDGVFAWTEIDSYRAEGDRCITYVLNITSQRYIDESFSSRSLWWHFLMIAVPDTFRRDFAYLYIDGGNNGDGSQPPNADDGRLALVRNIANLGGYVGALLLQVPNQGVIFGNDPTQRSRTEDAFIAWTWKTFIDPTDAHYKDPNIIARMPMTKAGKRGLDAIHEFIQDKTGRVVDQFAVGGGSKRGWTAWSVAATDRRVVAVTPMVMSLLNFNDTLQSHFRNLGGWTWVFNDYYEQNLTQHFHDDDVTNWVDGLWNYEDMFRYKERLELIPKLVISATGDEFFLVTDHPNWWDDMGGQKWLMMNQNVGHGLDNAYDKIGETVLTWLVMLLEPVVPNVPEVVWLSGSTATGGHLLVSVNPVPDLIQSWTAHTWRNETGKDFRMTVGFPPYLHSVVWEISGVTDLGGGMYEVDLEDDLPGFGGIFIECMWRRLTGSSIYLSTEVLITPNVYPYPGCYGIECYGRLV